MPSLQRISSKFTGIPHIEIDFSTKNIEESVAPWFFFWVWRSTEKEQGRNPLSLDNFSFLEILSVGSSNSFYEAWLIKIEPLTFTYPLGGRMVCAKYFDNPVEQSWTSIPYTLLLQQFHGMYPP